MSSSDPIIEVRGLGKRYDIYANPRDRLKHLIVPKLSRLFGYPHTQSSYHREFWALQDISFDVRPGETLGIIGRNGGGKSTLLQILAGTLAPTIGDVNVKGRVAALLELGSGFNPDFTGRENVLLNSRILGLSREQIELSYDAIVEFADIGDFIDQPVKTYSSGMFVRLAFAVQAHINASIVIIDEALAVGDVFFRQKCYARLEEIRASGAAVLLVSHAMTDIEQFCDRAILLDQGKMNFIGASTEAAKRYYQLYQDQTPRVASTKDETCTFTQKVNLSRSSSLNYWPNNDDFTDASNQVQVGNDWAKCLRYAVCDDKGNRCASFAQGDKAVFYSEFITLKSISIPLAGVVLQNERGINVHGKGSLEHYSEAPNHIPAGVLIQCRQTIELKLELGEYTYELGLATIDDETYRNMSNLNHEQIFSRIMRVCHLPRAGVLSVGWRPVRHGAPLTHHGITDLPGTFEYAFHNAE